ncbi:MAG: hypothetical protein LBK13_08720 [Spirochaetales bacterium]|nr:hypothetical protein [Spirochaetales bacterium]
MEKTTEGILRGEIAGVCKLLDEEALVFLKRQADVLLHNSRVEKMRREAVAEGVSPGEESGGLSPRSDPQPEDRSVRIERTGDVTFNVLVGGKRVFFNREELRALAKICHAAGDDEEGGRRLFAWFKRERGDFLVDAKISVAASPVLVDLCALIVRTYTVKE